MSSIPRFTRSLSWLIVGWLSLSASAQRLEAPGSDLVDQLSGQGIRLSERQSVPLPEPSLSPEQTPAERAAIFERLAGSSGWAKFTRESVYAPVMIDIEYLHDDSGTRSGHSIHTAFIAYAPLSTLQDDDLMREIFGPAPSGDPAAEPASDRGNKTEAGAVPATEIPEPELRQLGIAPPDRHAERYVAVELPLLNRVIVRGTVKIERRAGPNSIQLFWHIDPRFAQSEKFGNTWTKIERDEQGRPVQTGPRPYAGCGGFLSVTEIDAERNQLLIESRMILHEPVDWFAGSNFLRAKLPPAQQESARSFRRRLSK